MEMSSAVVCSGILVVALSCLTPCSSDTLPQFSKHVKKRAIGEIMSNITTFRKCECRNRCAWDSVCLAVTATQVKLKENRPFYQCTFHSNVDDELTEDGKSTTYKLVSCDSPFELVEGIGCIWLSTSTAAYDVAVTSCPAGSRLFSPLSLEHFTRLRNYFLKNLEKDSNFPKNVYIGLKRNSSNKLWEWAKGGNFEANHESGVYPFHYPDPDGHVDCARMIYIFKQGAQYEYHFADGSCASRYNYLCQIG